MLLSQQYDPAGKLSDTELDLLSYLHDQLDDLILQERFLSDNVKLASNTVLLAESGIISPISELLTTSMHNHLILTDS